IFSNGTLNMVTAPLQTSRSISEAASHVFPPDKVVSVDAETLRVFKPDPRTYKHMATVAGLQDAPEKAWLVSSNPFDALGAVAAGMRAAWVDRGGAGWIDGLGGVLGIRPTMVVKGVDEAVQAILDGSIQE